MGIYEELKQRGLVAQVTDEAAVKELINSGKAVFYIGFDPTADSLHVGHFMALTLMKRLQQAGNTPIALLGGGTAMVGDPSGKTDMRRMLSKDSLDYNCACIKKQLESFIDFSDDKGMLVNNADWLRQLNYIDFLREVGACFSVNRMLTAECYKLRLEKGLSFLEFNYMIMQSYDFYMLYKKYGCNLQFGGDDQWSNMIGGMELVRRKAGDGSANAMTITLLLTADGKKMGKTEKGTVWLDENKTTPYEFYQYWRNVADTDVIRFMKLLTFLPLGEIQKYESLEGSKLNSAKEVLAFEITKLVHGQEKAAAAQAAARVLFGGGTDNADLPETAVAEADFTDSKITVVELMLKANMVKSKGEGRRLIEQGGVSVGDKKVAAPFEALDKSELSGGVIIKKGKKIFHKFIFTP